MNEELCEDFESYDHGWRRGTFDKCNGFPHYDMSNVRLDSIWRAGYEEAWNDNEVRINNYVSSDRP